MWYTLPDSNKQYPLSIETVKKIKALNSKGIQPEELETEEVASVSKTKEPEPQFVDVVGQISLRSLERNAQRRKGARGQQQGSRDGGQGSRRQQPAARPQKPTRDEGQGTRPQLNKPSDRRDNRGPRPQGKQIKLNRNDQGTPRDPA